MTKADEFFPVNFHEIIISIVLQKLGVSYLIMSFLYILRLVFHSQVQDCVLVVCTQLTERRHNIANILYDIRSMFDETTTLLKYKNTTHNEMVAFTVSPFVSYIKLYLLQANHNLIFVTKCERSLRTQANMITIWRLKQKPQQVTTKILTEAFMVKKHG